MAGAYVGRTSGRVNGSNLAVASIATARSGITIVRHKRHYRPRQSNRLLDLESSLASYAGLPPSSAAAIGLVLGKGRSAMTSPNFEHLKAHILPLSVAKIFEAARQEWELVAVEISDEWDNCPCGQEIKEHCYIRNRHNGNTTYVGNVCINRFIQIDTGNLFDGLKRIAQDDSANANIDLIEHAYRMGYLYNEKEYHFLLQTVRKRILSQAQLNWKRKINRRILAQTIVQRRTKR